MMDIALISVISAIVLTYALSRVTYRALPVLDGLPRLIAAHFLSLAILVILIGKARAYLSVFAVEETLVLFLPALFWILLDWLRGKADGQRRDIHNNCSS